MKKILITGCCGFVGSELVKRLINKYKIYGIDDLSVGKKIIKHKNFKFIKGSCEQKHPYKKIKEKIDYIYHLAGQSSGEKSFHNPEDDLIRNLLTTVNLLDFAIKQKSKRFIFASSMSVYGDSYLKKVSEFHEPNPKSFYGLSKLSSENYIKKYKKKGIKFTILRLFNIYGESQKLNNYKQGMLRIYLSQIINQGKLIIKGSKERFRDFIHIKTVLDYFEEIPENSKTINQVINIGSGQKIFVKEIVEILKKNINKEFKVKYEGSTPLDQKGIYSDNKKAKKIFKSYLNYNSKKKIIEMIRGMQIS